MEKILSNEDYLKQIIDILDANIPPQITLDALNSGTLDLGEELDEFDGEVKEDIGVDESNPPSIEVAKSTILDVIELAKSDTKMNRSDLLIFLLEVLNEKLDDLIF